MNFWIYDDFLHLGGACEAAQILGPYRAFLYWLTCFLGSSPVLVKFFSAIVTVFSLWLMQRHVLSRFRESSGGIGTAILASIHPLIFFPVFYASQISTAVTLLWLALTLAAISIEKRAASIMLVIVLAVCSNFVRSESSILLVIYGAFLFAYWVWRGEAASKREWFAKLVICALLSGFILPRIVSGFTYRFDDAISLITADELDYPEGSWISIQFWAMLLYLRSFIVPWVAPFYGNWTDWYRWADLMPATAMLGALGVAGIFAFGFALATRKRFPFCSGIVFCLFTFCALAFAHSIRSRPDWYFLSRTTLPAFLALSIFVDHLRRMKRLMALRGLAIICVSATLFQMTMHYRSEQVFLNHESRWSSRSPSLHLAWGDYFKKRQDYPSALDEYYRAYSLIQPEVAQASARARAYKTIALYEGYRISKRIGNEHSAATALKSLMSYNNLYSAVACFLSREFSDEQCVIAENRVRFCSLVKTPMNQILLKNALSEIHESVDRVCAGVSGP